MLFNQPTLSGKPIIGNKSARNMHGATQWTQVDFKDWGGTTEEGWTEMLWAGPKAVPRWQDRGLWRDGWAWEGVGRVAELSSPSSPPRREVTFAPNLLPILHRPAAQYPPNLAPGCNPGHLAILWRGLRISKGLALNFS